MVITAPLLNSDKWYKFVSEHAVKDAEVQRCIKDYISAHTKLTNRVTALAKAYPDFDIEVQRASEKTVTDGAVQEIRAYHEKHGNSLSAEQICTEARSLGYEIVHITEKNAA